MSADTVSAVQGSTESSRPSANFHPTIWGYHFLDYASDFMTIDNSMKPEYDELKEEVRRMLTTAVVLDKPLQKLDMINAVQRLGVSYHFEVEIEDALEKIYHDTTDFDHGGDDDLYTASLRFRLLRQQGYGVSCDTFNKFKDEEGNFKKSLICDIRGMLSLYEAAHLSTHADEILDEALVFTTTHLEEYSPNASPHDLLAKQVIHALNRPLRKGLPRLETRHFLAVYQDDETLLRFAKLDFNIIQAQHQKELSYLTKWWKDLDIPTNLPHARDRLVELYFWITGVYFEPRYYISRRMISKSICMISLMDDTYDAYATFEEIELFTKAMDRWDMSCMNELPVYMKFLYCAILTIYNEMEQETTQEGRPYCINYAKEAMKDLGKAYYSEAKWCRQGHIPTMEDYMIVGLVTSTYPLFATTAFVGMGDIANKDAFDWVSSKPKILRAASFIGRFTDDIVSHKFEQERGQHVASAVECYMEQHGVTEEQAVDYLRKKVRDAWKDINEGLLKPANDVPMPLLERILNLARAIDVIYKDGDGYTNSSRIKDSVSSLLVVPISV